MKYVNKPGQTNQEIYLTCLVHKAIIKSLSYLAKELAIIHIIKIDRHGGVGGSLLDGFNLKPVGNFVPFPIRSTLHEESSNSRLSLTLSPVKRFEAKNWKLTRCNIPQSCSMEEAKAGSQGNLARKEVAGSGDSDHICKDFSATRCNTKNPKSIYEKLKLN